MAWQERDYSRDEQGGGTLASRLTAQSFVTWLIVANIAVYVIEQMFFRIPDAGPRGPSRLDLWGAYTTAGMAQWQVWRLFTYQFLHADVGHVLFNMLSLFFFGPLIERWWGSRRFLAFYLISGMSGAIVFTALRAMGVVEGGWLVGASGSIFGILAAAALLFPQMPAMIYFIPMKMRTMALVLLGIAAWMIISGGKNAGGEAAHLGGAVMGLALVKLPWLLNWAELGGGRSPVARIAQAVQHQRDQRHRQQDDNLEAEVDRILIKVKAQGLHSLTEKEKKTLQKATERQRWVG
jgi:membrane associated rhomboid family serine protease